ncbi:penicillin acylase family protein [Streptomyces tagetis]|uniref:Penicillin acylase family protein n=1 Tax=Streptomyces tagetis TaxID=2820809 RepID=A0A941B0Z2_9ACTN|nr:penicillin acylase family protein [Streptomyces sp. RG38]MBQ0827875.1 penicillin acylase family protein [Streptomyces sp. RG38]
MSAETCRDAWGNPHLRADGPVALARAQGRVTARDHGWRLELRRHRAQGTSASFLGPDALPWDLFARRARLADTARRCHAALEERDPETAAWVRAYVDGVNEGLAEGAAPEFARAGLAPGRWEPWTPFAVRLAGHVLDGGFPAKLWREHVLDRLGPDALALFAADGPGGPPGGASGPRGLHRVRLSCPEFDVAGLAVPGVPGLAHCGHTGTVAWAVTGTARADCQDLYHERLRRTGAGVEALGPDGAWHRAARHTELIRVAGEGTVEAEVVETARGPVIAGGPEGLDDGTPAAISLRHPARVTADLGFGALLPLLRARRVADVDGALDAWSEPVDLVLAADTEGGTLCRTVGRVPLRADANRLRPVPAWQPGHEWRGWVRPADGDPGGPAGPGPTAPPDHEAVRPDPSPLLDRLAALDGPSPGAAALRDRLLAWHRGTRDGGGRGTDVAGDGGGADVAGDGEGRGTDVAGDGGGTDVIGAGDGAGSGDRGEEADAAAYAALRAAVVRRITADPALAALATPPGHPEVFQPWLDLAPRVGHALERLLRAPHLYGVDRTGAVREAAEEVAARPPAPVPATPVPATPVPSAPVPPARRGDRRAAPPPPGPRWQAPRHAPAVADVERLLREGRP